MTTPRAARVPADERPVDTQTVSLVGMRFHALVGILPHEREVGQPLEVDVRAVRAGPASSFARGDVLDYRRVYAVVAAVAAGPVEWLEDAAGEIADRLLAAEALAHVRVAVRKPHVALGGPLAYAEVCVERDAPAPGYETAYVALGSNLGDRAGHLAAGRAGLDAAPGTRVAAASRVEETAPLGPAGQGAYLNQMLRVETSLAPEALLAAAQAVERAAGRTRDPALRWGPRTLDIDVVLFGARAVLAPGLTVPHPELARRDFWQRGLAELGVDWRAALERAGLGAAAVGA